MFFLYFNDYTLCFNGSPYCSISCYNYNSTRPYYSYSLGWINTETHGHKYPKQK